MRADVPADKGYLFYGRDNQPDAGRCLRDDSLSFAETIGPVNREHRAHAHGPRSRDISRGGLAGIAAEGPSQLPKTSSGVKSGLMPADKGTMSANRAIVRSIADLLNHSAGRHALIFAVI